MKRGNDFRARNHPAYWAFLVHRVSGLLLGLFLPVHFWALSRALHGAAALDGFLRLTENPLLHFSEWALVILLALHMMGGLRLLLIEFSPRPGLRKNWIAGAGGVGIAVGLAFALALIG